MESIEIKKISLAELYQLQEISRQTFSETFSELNTEDNMRIYLEEELSIEKLARELKKNNSAFYFASIGNDVIGYLKINSGDAQTELKDERGVEIERIYVLKEYQGKKVGQELYEKAVQVAREAKANYIWLGVWEENTKAINFYKKHGFKSFSKHLFKLGDDEQMDILMKLQLQDL